VLGDHQVRDHRGHQRDGDQRRGAGTPPLPLTAASTSRSRGAATSSAASSATTAATASTTTSSAIGPP
jgi:hypothetical protein